MKIATTISAFSSIMLALAFNTAAASQGSSASHPGPAVYGDHQSRFSCEDDSGKQMDVAIRFESRYSEENEASLYTYRVRGIAFGEQAAEERIIERINKDISYRKITGVFVTCAGADKIRAVIQLWDERKGSSGGTGRIWVEKDGSGNITVDVV